MESGCWGWAPGCRRERPEKSKHVCVMQQLLLGPFPPQEGAGSENCITLFWFFQKNCS